MNPIRRSLRARYLPLLLLSGLAFGSYEFVQAYNASSDGQGQPLDTVSISYLSVNGQTVNPADRQGQIAVNPGDVIYMEGELFAPNGQPRHAAPSSFLWQIDNANESCDLTQDGGCTADSSPDFQVSDTGVSFIVPSAFPQAATIVLTSNAPSAIDTTNSLPLPNRDTANLANASYRAAAESVSIVTVRETDANGGLFSLDRAQGVYLGTGQSLFLSADLLDASGVPANTAPSDYIWTLAGAPDACSAAACPPDSGLSLTDSGVLLTGQAGVDSAVVSVYSQNPASLDSNGISSIDSIQILHRPDPIPGSFNLTKIVALNDLYDPNHSREILVRPGAKISLSADILQSSLYFAPENAPVEDFQWSADDTVGGGADACDASQSFDCLTTSHFQVTDQGVDFYAPYDMPEAITLTVQSNDPSTRDANGVPSYDVIVLRNSYFAEHHRLENLLRVVFDSDDYGYDNFSYDLALAGHGRWVTIGGVEYFTPYTYAFDGDEEWAPYRHGRWVWVEGDGLTWVSYDPWGWVTDHYGVWRYHSVYGWVWLPFAHQQYVPHAVSWSYSDNAIGWYPYYGDYAAAYVDGDRDHWGFNDGFWEGDRAADRFGQHGYSHNPGLTIVRRDRGGDNITNVSDVHDAYEHTLIAQNGGWSVNPNVSGVVSDAGWQGHHARHLGGGDLESSRGYLQSHLQSGDSLRTSEKREVTTSDGKKLEFAPKASQPAVYQKVGAGLSLGKDKPVPVGSVLVVSADQQHAKVVPPTTNGKGISAAPRVVDGKNGAVQIIAAHSKNPAKPQPPSASPAAAAKTAFPVKSNVPVAAPSVAKAPSFRPSQVPSGPITAKPAPGIAAPKTQPSANPPKAPPVPKAAADQADKKAAQQSDAQAKAAQAAADKAKADAAAQAAKLAQEQAANHAALVKKAAADQAAADQAHQAAQAAQTADTQKAQALAAAKAAADTAQKASAQATAAKAPLAAAANEKDGALKTAQASLAAANAALSGDQQQLQKQQAAAQKAGADAQAAQASVTAVQAALGTAPADLQKLQAAAAQANTQAQAAQAAVTAAQAALGTAPADLQKLQSAAAQANTQAQAAQAAVTAAQAIVSNGPADLQKLQTAAAQASAQLQPAQNAVASATNAANSADAALAPLQTAVAQANSAAQGAGGPVNNAQAAVNAANQAVAAAQSNAANATRAVQAAQQAQSAAAAAAAKNAKDAGLQQKLAAANAALAQAQNAANQANAQIAPKQAAAANAQTSLRNAQAALAQAQQAQSRASAALAAGQTQANNAKANLARAQAALASLQAAIAQANAAVAAKQAQVQAAQASLVKAQGELTAAQKAQSDANAAVAAKQAQVKGAQDNLAKAQAALTAAQKAQSDANAAVAAKQAQLKGAQDNLAKAQATLTAAQKAQSDAGAAVTAAQAKVAADQAKVAPAQQAVNVAQQAAAQASQALTTATAAETAALVKSQAANAALAKATGDKAAADSDLNAKIAYAKAADARAAASKKAAG